MIELLVIGALVYAAVGGDDDDDASPASPDALRFVGYFGARSFVVERHRKGWRWSMRGSVDTGAGTEDTAAAAMLSALEYLAPNFDAIAPIRIAAGRGDHFTEPGGAVLIEVQAYALGDPAVWYLEITGQGIGAKKLEQPSRAAAVQQGIDYLDDELLDEVAG